MPEYGLEQDWHLVMLCPVPHIVQAHTQSYSELKRPLSEKPCTSAEGVPQADGSSLDGSRQDPLALYGPH